MSAIEKAEEYLRSMIRSWRSRYRCTLSTINCTMGEVPTTWFRTDWCRRPTPHEPIPNVRIRIEFAVRFNSALPEPEVSFRIEEDSLMMAASVGNSIDHMILAALKNKTVFYETPRQQFNLERPQFYETRQVPDAFTPVLSEAMLSVPFSNVEVSVGRDLDLEAKLIQMFKDADADNSGGLDNAEFKRLLANSGGHFNPQDVEHIMNVCDKNNDGILVYKEFIPIALDLVQANNACKFVDDALEKELLVLKKNAETRYSYVKEALEATIVIEVPKHTVEGRISLQRLVRLLRNSSPAMDEHEVAAASRIFEGKLSVGLDGRPGLIADDLQQTFPAVVSRALEEAQWDKNASNLEALLADMFRAKDRFRLGRVSEGDTLEVLRSCDRLRLSSSQTFSLMRGKHGVASGYLPDHRLFCRKAAQTVAKIFDPSALAEKKALLERSAVMPVELLDAKSREQIDKKMAAKFSEFDADYDGKLSLEEFHKCISDTSLCLSREDISKLFVQADHDKDGYLNSSEFLMFAYHKLLNLARDAVLESQKAKV